MRICDECNYGSYQGRCVICGGPGVSDAYYCKECTIQEKDVSVMKHTWLLFICHWLYLTGHIYELFVIFHYLLLLFSEEIRSTFKQLKLKIIVSPRTVEVPWDENVNRLFSPLSVFQRDGCPKIVNLGSSKTDLFYERKKYGFKKRWSRDGPVLVLVFLLMQVFPPPFFFFLNLKKSVFDLSIKLSFIFLSSRLCY